MRPFISSLGLVSLVFVLSACSSQGLAGGGPVFEFASGGANHPQGFGEWRLRLDSSGNLGIVHDVQGKVKDYGAFKLTEQEAAELWALIRAAEIGKLKASDRLGVPDEVAYTFGLREGGATNTARIWINDAADNEPLMAVVDQLGLLIERYARVKPVLQ